LSQGQELIAVVENLLEIIKRYSTASEQFVIEDSCQDEPEPTEPMGALPEILTAQDIADYLHISRNTVYEYFKINPEYGGIPCISIGTSRRVDKEDFRDWIKNQKRWPPK